jgi:predicted 3-demethylubiquinone-9 3-methyltransferase (glyoxalase superfamily)
MKEKIFPCIWMNGNSEEAAAFYQSIFKDTTFSKETPYVVMMHSAGQQFMFLNGGPMFNPNPSISFYVNLLNEQEVNDTWEALTKDGQIMMPLGHYPWASKYGFLQDKYGVCWQIALGRPESVSKKFTPFFSFTGSQFGRAEEAVNYYTSVFANSSILGIKKHKANPSSEMETVMHAQFDLCGQVFMIVDSGAPHVFQFNEGVSFVINCQSQEEIDFYWNHLTEGGSESRCGWLKDKFGVSWQVVPEKMGEWMSDPEKSKRVTGAFMQMKKLDWDILEHA